MEKTGALQVSLIILLSITSLLLVSVFPHESLSAAVNGISIWWEVLFPALFPFFVISECLLGFGIVHFFGSVLDPMMRPVFKVPGVGGFVMAMGFASGYPVGARMTLQIWQQGYLHKHEAERLLAFTTTADPIFLVGAVCVGFFKDTSLALILIVAHYLGAVIVGILMRYYRRSANSEVDSTSTTHSWWFRAFEAMHQARLRDGRPPGTIIAQAIRHALQLIFIIGGLVVFFSVLLEVFSTGKLLHGMDELIGIVLTVVGIPPELSSAILHGLVEVTLGAQTAAQQVGSISLMSTTAVTAFIISWAGLSVHTQIMSMVSAMNISYVPFFVARFTHGLISALLVIVLWNPLQPIRQTFVEFFPSFPHQTSMLHFTAYTLPLQLWIFIGCFIIIFVLYSGHLLIKKCMNA